MLSDATAIPHSQPALQMEGKVGERERDGRLHSSVEPFTESRLLCFWHEDGTGQSELVLTPVVSLPSRRPVHSFSSVRG